MSGFSSILPGDPAPWFKQRCSGKPQFSFENMAGRYLVLCFFATASGAQVRAAMKAITANRQLFDGVTAAFFGVSVDPADEQQNRVCDILPGIRIVWDFDASVSKLYGAVPTEAVEGKVQVRRLWFVLDPTLRVLNVIPFNGEDGNVGAVLAYLQGLPPPSRFAGIEIQAPILFLANVFEPKLCATLIGQYEKHGGEVSGFMQEKDGKTILAHNPLKKVRKDYNVSDPAMIEATRARIGRRIVPEIMKVHQFKVTRMERHIVCCYEADDGGHFRAHRDNTTKGTAHRRFAVSINLNAEFEGGEISFPEYGTRSFKPPPGGAVVFSCSLMHEVSPVTRGRRFAFLPFLYDDEAAKLREANNAFLGEGVGTYQRG